MNQLLEIINRGGVAVMKTDTLYGLVASAFNPSAVNTIYSIKKRDLQKPLIVLISDINQLTLFDATLDENTQCVCNEYWPGPTSIILDVAHTDLFKEIHRGSGSIAFRLPEDLRVRRIIDATGPLCAPSANPEGYPPATSVAMAKAYFGGQVDYYDDQGVSMVTKASRLIRIDKNGAVTELRK